MKTATQIATDCLNCGHRLKVSQRYSGRSVRCRQCGFVRTRPRRRQSLGRGGEDSPVPADAYRVEAILEGGGPGRIYLARHVVSNEPCVVKTLGPDDPGYSAEACERLEREARFGHRIRHPGVVRILGVHRSGPAWYLVMEFAEGANLAEVLEENERLVWMQAADIGSKAADALAAIHRAGLVHRDIKPANILLQPDGTVKIADLGLAASVSEAGDPGLADGVVGTPPYVPPEQRQPSARLNQQADVYALGATLYHLLTGQRPQRNKSPLAYLCGQEYEPIVWDRDITPPIPEWFHEIVETCLAQSVEQRFYDAAELSRLLAERGGSLDDVSRRAPAPARRAGNIAVVAFANRGGSKRDNWVGDALADHVSHRIVELQDLHLIDRHEFAVLVERLCERPAVDATDADLREASELAGVATVIRGSFALEGETVLVEAHALHVRDGTTTLLLDRSEPLSRILSFETDLGMAVIQALGYADMPRVSGRIFPKGTTNPAAQRFYAEGQRAFADGDYVRAIEHARAALEADPDFVDLIGFIGVCYAREGKNDSAIEYHKRLKEIADENNDPYRLAEAVSNMGVMHYFKGDYGAAYELLTSANRLERELNLLPILSKNYSNLGFVLTKMERLEDADQAFRKAIEIMTELGTVASLMSPYNGRGEVALQRGRYREAADHYRTALAWARKIKDQVNVGICHANLGRCAGYMGALDEADRHFHAALEKLRNTTFWHGLALVYEHMAELNLLRNRIDEALNCIEERTKLAQRHENRRMEAAAWEQKARAYELSGQTETAVDCLRKSFEINRRPVPAGDLGEYLEAVARRLPYGQEPAGT